MLLRVSVNTLTLLVQMICLRTRLGGVSCNSLKHSCNSLKQWSKGTKTKDLVPTASTMENGLKIRNGVESHSMLYLKVYVQEEQVSRP